jgi:hypothetical protein
MYHTFFSTGADQMPASISQSRKPLLGCGPTLVLEAKSLGGTYGKCDRVNCQQSGQTKATGDLLIIKLVAILEEKWAEVMSKDQAGHFIHECQELRDQVQQMITQDSRYQALKAIRAARWR